jgi:hypothetical protein
MLITYVHAGIGHDEVLRAVMTDQRLRRLVTRAIIDDLADRVDSSSVDRNAARRLIRALGEIDAEVATRPAAPRKRVPGDDGPPAFRSDAHALKWAKAHRNDPSPKHASLARAILRDLAPKLADRRVPATPVATRAQSRGTER